VINANGPHRAARGRHEGGHHADEHRPESPVRTQVLQYGISQLEGKQGYGFCNCWLADSSLLDVSILGCLDLGRDATARSLT
jgi:hypothetical protein